MDMEMMGVATIKLLVGACPRLRPVIDDNDKTPFTDGHIDVYSGTSRKNEDHVGRVTVQVKGRVASRKKKRTQSFSIDRSALRMFQQNGGALYFVVSRDPKTGDRTPYHAILNPFKIEALFDQVPESQKSISVSLSVLPDAPDEIERIVHLALKGQAQNPSLGVDPILFEKMQSINIFTAQDLDWSAPVELTPGEVDFMLEMTTSSGSVVPLSGAFKVVPSDYLAHDAESAVSAGEVTYDHVLVRRVDADSVEVILDEGLALVMSQDSNRKAFDVNFTPQSNFAVRLKALEFFTGIVDHGKISVNERTYNLSYGPGGHPKRRVTELRQHLDYLRDLRDLFTHLGVEGGRIELDDVDDEQAQGLLNLHRAFIQGKELTNKNGKASRGILTVGHWALMVLVVPGGSPSSWRFVDPFHPDTQQLFRLSTVLDDHESVFVTVYDVIEKEQLPRILNLRLDSVVAAYEALVDFDHTLSLANLFVLDLISAADACPPRKDEFLRGARVLNEWIITREGKEPIHLINRWQIEWRIGPLAQGEQDAIRDLKRNMVSTRPKHAGQIELACALLLEDAGEVSYLAGRLPGEQLEKMKEWPIWRLRRQSEERAGAKDGADKSAL